MTSPRLHSHGVSQTEMPKDEYICITHDYSLAAAKAFLSLSDTEKFNFVYIPSEGADPTENGAQSPEESGAALLVLPSMHIYSALRVYNVRPGYVDSPEHYRLRSVAKKIVQFVVRPSMRLLMAGEVSSTSVLSKVLVDLATGDGNALQGGCEWN